MDYDGRGPYESPKEEALWIPRFLLAPIYVATEYFVRLPLGELGKLIEKYDLIGLLLSPSRIGVIPTAFIDFGLRPSFGAYFFFNDFLAPGNDLRANLSFGGLRFWRAGLADRIPFVSPIGQERARSYFQAETDLLVRQDLRYWGIGPETREDNRSTYEIFTYGGGARIHVEPWRGRIFEGWVTGRYTITGAGACNEEKIDIGDDNTVYRSCSPPTVRRQILDGVFPPPPGYGRAYATVKSGLRVVLDSREERPAPGTGLALDVSAEQVSEVLEPKLQGWVNWGGVAAGFLDITGTQRVVSLAVAARFQDALRDDATIPFTELVGAKHVEDVPDLDMMRGFRSGRLLGHSALVATVEYRWPIWAFIDGTLQAAVGNAFEGAHLDDFEPDKLRFSFAGGLRSPNHRDHSFNVLAGFGTETFGQGGAPTSFRLLFGGTTGF